ncbi:TonB-dependent receptor plug domain-containing protein [Cellvibrio mixtus]|uniref:TonB-dependent receptor plug domain-containing protein n=1 Tax=Cellvibrio mixtus TaxID=39650 RepID=UPI000B2C5300|nr:TonB-dependent receptor [Cellvibrio mixtus]
MSHFVRGTVATLVIAVSPLVYSAENAAPAAATAPSSEAGDEVQEVLVFGLRKASYTVITENTEKLVNMPGSFGDPLGAVSALPGVIIPRDGGSPAVRGGAPEDNRYYVDGMPAGYIFHDFNTSIFDENVIQDFQLFSAGFGVQYSQATGAIFDIRLRDPENKDLSTKLSASFLRAGIFVESGITDNSAFYLSARKGLLQYFISEDDEPDDDGLRIISPPEDNDYQFKYKWDINSEHSIAFSLAGANDFVEAEFTELADDVQKNPDFAGDAKVDKEFNSGGLNYEYAAESGAQFRLTLAKYADSELVTWGDDYSLELQLDSELARAQYTIPLGDSGHRLGMGVEYNEKVYDYSARMIHFVCTDFDVDCQDGRGELIDTGEKLSVAESSIYLLDNWQVTDRVNVEVGVQRSGNDYTDDYFVNPRAALSWGLTDSLTLISSAGEYNRTPDVDTILRVVGNPELHALEAKHFTYGFKNEFNDYWSVIVEGYHKELTNLPLALNNGEPDANLFYTNDVEGEVNGVDLMLNKNLSNKWFGWVSVSYAESERTNLRTGQTRTYTLDTPWLVNLVANYQLTQKWNAGFRFNYRSGEATTKIIGIQPNPDFSDKYIPIYGEAFGTRLPPYTRLDVRFERDLVMFGKESSFFIDILNVLNRENVSQRVLDYEKVNDTGELHQRDSVDMGVFGSLGVSITL